MTPGLRRVLVLALFVTLVLALNLGGSWLAQQIEFQVFPRHDALMQSIVLAVAALYLLLMALPFMPGIELGLALLVLLGPKGAVLIYLCTVAALCLSFAVGRMLSPLLLIRLLETLHLGRAAALVRELRPLNCSDRLGLLMSKAPTRVVPFLLAHRYWAIAAALNLPGNALIGGGGGIGLVVGISGLVPFRHYAGLVALAVAPVPAFFLLGGD